MIKRLFIQFPIVLMLLLPFSEAWAQQQAVSLSLSNFDKNEHIRLTDSPDWEFKLGSNTDWETANKESNGWEPLSPGQLSLNQADESGKLEGWFRIKLRTESLIAAKPLFIYFRNPGSAVDMYVDGKLIKSFGNTGNIGGTYARVNAKKADFFLPFECKADSTYLFSFYYRYLPASFPANLFPLHTQYKFYVGIAGQNFQEIIQSQKDTDLVVDIFRVTVCLILTFLFVLLLIQNPQEKILKLIVFSSILYIIITGAMAIGSGLIDLPHSLLILVWVGANICSSMLIFSIILIFSYVFTGKMPKRVWLHILLAVALAYYFTLVYNPVVDGVLMLTVFGICIQYIVLAWKKVKGAQWAIITGFIITVLAMIGYALASIYPEWENDTLYWNFITLSFPLSLLVYVSMRFKEVILEVREKAAQLVNVTEEKRQQSLNQQVILEKEVKERTAELSRSLENLKATQAQLIQSEKMASLGELTAGIAHEIQNPLNFVNNFSEVNTELIKELKDEVIKGNLNEVTSIANDIESNSEKINHHGKRADAIVKGMLQHSRSSGGHKEPTDINALCDEYLRLAYHGLKAKDQSFNADFRFEPDNTLPKINVVPQDIGRVLLNLINNAFQAVSERKKIEGANYKPEVIVSTKLVSPLAGGLRGAVIVSDNGPGIPNSIIDKIFQPFFTTKPTGQGTGLGLSLSYDIVKAHGGELIVKTEERKGTEFIIQLPTGI